MRILIAIRPTRPRTRALVWLLSAALSLTAHSQRLSPLLPPLSAFEPVKEEVKRPVPFTEQELKVIDNVPSLPTERLIELMRVYDRLDNDAMALILVREVLKRSPYHEEAMRIAASLDPSEEVRSFGYLDRLAAKLLSGQKVDDTDGIAAQAGAWQLEHRASEAVTLLETLRNLNYQGQRFPYLDALGSAYQDAGLYDKATSAYEAVLKDSAATAEARQEAEKALPVIALQQRIAGLREQSLRNPDLGLKLSADLLAELPKDPLVILFRIESFHRAGRFEDSIRFIEDLRRAGNDPFAFQEGLAYASYGAKQWDRARREFLELMNNPAFPPEQRLGAQNMLTVLSVDERIEKGVAALTKFDIPAAEKILADLEREFPRNREVFAFRCLVMARTGRSQEALEALLKLRVQATQERRLFLELDTLGDVYMERKEFALAIDAYREIIDTPDFDAIMRVAAVRALDDAKRAQIIYKAYRALEDGNPSVAKRISEELRSTWPLSPDVQVLNADIDLAYGRAESALADFQDLKSRRYPDQPFPGQGGIATAEFRLGKWEDALASYNEILDRPGYEPADVWSARWDRRSLLPFVQNVLTADSRLMHESEGTLFSQALAYASPWSNGWRFIASAREDFIRLDDAKRFTRDGSVDRFESKAAVQRRLEGGHFAEVSGGGTEDHVLYGARVGKYASTGVGWGSIGWSLGFSGNAAADYSLPLRAINGRENRIDLDVAGYLHPRWRLDSNAYASWVHVDNEEIGDGHGASGRLDYIITTETRTRAELAVGYAGEYTRFHSKSKLPNSVARELRGEELQVRRALSIDEEVRTALPSDHGREVFDSLIEPETNRHGVIVSVRKRLDLDWNVYAEVGGYRDFVDSSWEYFEAAGVEYWLSDHAMLYLQLRYDSNGVASAEGVWEASLGAATTF